MVDPVNRGYARDDPAGEDRFIKCLEMIRRDEMIQFKRHARDVDHPPVVTQRFVKFFFAGDLFGDIKLPANLAMCIKQRDLMPACGGVDGKRQSCRARADDGEIFLF